MQKNGPYVGFRSINFGVNSDISVGEDGLHLGEYVLKHSYSFFKFCVALGFTITPDVKCDTKITLKMKKIKQFLSFHEEIFMIQDGKIFSNSVKLTGTIVSLFMNLSLSYNLLSQHNT